MKQFKLEIETDEYYNVEDELYQSDSIFLIFDIKREGNIGYEYKNLTLNSRYFTDLVEDFRNIDQDIEYYNNKIELLTEFSDNDEEIEYRDDKIIEYKECIEELKEQKIELMKDYEELKSKYYIFDLYAYVHSGVSFSISSGYPFNCQWDSGQCGLVFVSIEEFPDINKAEKQAKNYVETLNELYAGEVYQIQLFEITKCECCGRDDEDSLGSLGMIIGTDSLRDEITRMLEENNVKEEQVINLKELKEEWYF